MNVLKIFGSLALILIAVVWLHHATHPKPLDDEAMPPYGVGLVLAEEAAKAAHDAGRVVLVCMPMSSVRGVAEMEGFQKSIIFKRYNLHE